MIICICLFPTAGCDDSQPVINSDTDSDCDADSDCEADSDSEPDQAYPGPCEENVDWSDGGEGFPDGTINRRTIYAYDDLGRLIMVEFDKHATGHVYGRTTYTHDNNDNILTLERDGNFSEMSDGTIDNRSTYTYDSQGNQLTDEFDDGPNGIVDRRITRTFNDQGLVLTEEQDWATENEGSGADGITDIRHTYTYDTYGNILTYEVDGGSEPADGTIERSISYVYTYDGNNNVLEQEEYRSDYEEMFSLTVYTYDSFDRVLSIIRHAHVEADANTQTYYTYNQDGSLLTSEHYTDGGGTILSYTYDDFQNVILITRDNTNGGIGVDEHYIYTYDCWAGWEG